MNNESKSFAVILALLAAFFNGMVGVFSVNLFNSGLPPQSVAFFKCVLAFTIIGVILVLTNKAKDVVSYLKAKWFYVAICSFFGFFVLYHFETAAYETVNVAVVVFCLFGSATITTFVVEAIIEKRFFSLAEFISITLALFGLYFIFIDNEVGFDNGEGLSFALLSGLGYGLFIVLSKKLKIGSGLITVFSLLLFALVYLFFPFALSGYSIPSSDNFIDLTLLALLPTIGGFWCTTKALTILKSQSVQLIELTEPIFAIIFGLIFLGQLTTVFQIIGGAFIMLSIVSYEFLPMYMDKRKISSKVKS